MRFACLALLVLVACGKDTSSPKVEVHTDLPAKLLKEFEGSYVEEAPVSTGVREFSMVAKESEVELFEGTRLKVWAYNEQVPGPVFRIKLGETFHLDFKNELPMDTTIHFHGVRVPNAMDGVPGVTQPPIKPGESFVYEFVPKDAGTFWFHPHVRGSEQVERGLFGVLIVEDPQVAPYSQDVVWVLDDWRLGQDGQIDPRFMTRGDLMHDGRWGQHITVNGKTREELQVKAGERIRLRLVNTSNGRVYTPTFAGLDAKVIAVDGMYSSKPLPPEGWAIAPGNRLDLDITFREDQQGEVYTIEDVFTRRSNALADIRVLSEVVETPSFASPAKAYVPEWKEGMQVDIHTELTLQARRGGKHGIQWLINDRAYGEHEVQALAKGKWQRMRFTNLSGRIHPMHIHGQFFKVLSRDGDNQREPYFRDTVLVRPRQTVDVGIVPLDPGDWMFHCHILEHAESGMMTVVQVR